jgi:hypothetical protein
MPQTESICCIFTPMASHLTCTQWQFEKSRVGRLHPQDFVFSDDKHLLLSLK